MTEHNLVLRIEKGKAEVVELPMPVPAEGFVLVRQEIAPICIEHRVYETGFYEWHEGPEHCGHEGVGEIVEVGPVVLGEFIFPLMSSRDSALGSVNVRKAIPRRETVLDLGIASAMASRRSLASRFRETKIDSIPTALQVFSILNASAFDCI